MALYYFHRVLISAAILFDLFFTYFCIRKYNVSGDSTQIVLAVGSSVVVMGLAAYLIYFNKRLTNLREALREQLLCSKCEYDLRGTLAKGLAECPECGEPISHVLRHRTATV